MRARTLTQTLVRTVLLLVAAFLSQQAQAVPSFARQTGLACNACHTIAPQLNAFGRFFKLHGYVLGSEKLSGGTSQNRFLSRENTAMSNSCPTRNAVAEAIAIRGVDRNADRHSATAKPAITTVRARVGPSKRLVRSETRNANG